MDERVRLRDGSEVVIRPVTAADKPLFVRERRDSDVAEAAVVVVDDWQGRGLGTELLRRLAARAQVNGVRRFSAVLFTGNTAMRHLFQALGETRVRTRGPGDTMTLEIRLPVADGRVLQSALSAAARGDVAGSPD